MSNSLWSHGLQYTRPPGPSPTPRVYPNSCASINDAIQPSHSLLSPSLPALNLSQHQSFQMSHLFVCIKWPKYWSFSFNIIPSSEHSELISFRMDWLDLLAVQGTIKRNQGFRIPKINSILPQLNMANDREESKGINLHTTKEDKLPRKANSGFSS